MPPAIWSTSSVINPSIGMTWGYFDDETNFDDDLLHLLPIKTDAEQPLYFCMKLVQFIWYILLSLHNFSWEHFLTIQNLSEGYLNWLNFACHLGDCISTNQGWITWMWGLKCYWNFKNSIQYTSQEILLCTVTCSNQTIVSCLSLCMLSLHSTISLFFIHYCALN